MDSRSNCLVGLVYFELVFLAVDLVFVVVSAAAAAAVAAVAEVAAAFSMVALGFVFSTVVFWHLVVAAVVVLSLVGWL